MPLVVDERLAQASSRVSAVRIAMFTLRSMENWRSIVDDCEKTLVMLAVGTINAERLIRAEELEEKFRDLRNELPNEHFRQCNVSSVAAATGLNRETARRKVNELIDAGLLVRTGRGRLRYTPGFSQLPSVSELVRKQLEGVVRVANDLIRDGILTLD
jgi:capsid protein